MPSGASAFWLAGERFDPNQYQLQGALTGDAAKFWELWRSRLSFS
jgi:hypothetical protein